MRRNYKKKIKPQNRLRIVFWEKEGKPISFLHIENTEAQTFLKIIDEIRKQDSWVWLQKVAKKLKIPRLTFTWAISRMAGARYIDVQENGVYKRVMDGPLILVRKSRMHRNVQRGLEKPYMNPPIYVKAGKK